MCVALRTVLIAVVANLGNPAPCFLYNLTPCRFFDIGQDLGSSRHDTGADDIDSPRHGRRDSPAAPDEFDAQPARNFRRARAAKTDVEIPRA